MFSGSYDPQDVVFLLKPVRMQPTPVAEKERLIQSGQRHYSEMIGAEHPPSPSYLRLFHDTLEHTRKHFARHLLLLARFIAKARPEDITLVSLARAGTPVGAIVGRILRQVCGRTASHYSISIIRDRGIDEVALRWLLARYPARSLVFVDGWTGKGVMARELFKSVTKFNEQYQETVDPGLFTVADLSGTAAWAATTEDYLIPSSVLGCTISGLVSRSILNRAVVGPDDFHACLFHEEFRDQDLSRWFVETMMAEVQNLPAEKEYPGVDNNQAGKTHWQQQSEIFLQNMMTRFKIRDVNHIKPGIGEATRVLLRRVPDRLLLRDPSLPEVTHLCWLAREKNVPLVTEPALPYLAAALIKEIDG